MYGGIGNGYSFDMTDYTNNIAKKAKKQYSHFNLYYKVQLCNKTKKKIEEVIFENLRKKKMQSSPKTKVSNIGDLKKFILQSFIIHINFYKKVIFNYFVLGENKKRKQSTKEIFLILKCCKKLKFNTNNNRLCIIVEFCNCDLINSKVTKYCLISFRLLVFAFEIFSLDLSLLLFSLQ
ncbi:hypothetical protein RFI_14318 [Reticulomyxa filosa]|uniref:Uncharacterized protein n=1 Tax=Reticulomyxa filosa TaxID=46433 RepID=X6NAH8_RETFI|nr:hypothetical protein RFI_14318 [Reticulomyxa filosa]|eukprot:ETO22878.1 hypothetical protein RFI_14318 [Reticulomyxa filosa]